MQKIGLTFAVMIFSIFLISQTVNSQFADAQSSDNVDIRFVTETYSANQFINNRWTPVDQLFVDETYLIKETVRIEGEGTAPIFCIKFEVIEPDGTKVDNYRDLCTVKEITPSTAANPNISSNFNLLPKSPGTYTIIKTIDYKNDVVETDEQNNVSTRTVVVIDDTEPVVEPEPEVIEEPVVEPEPEVIEEPVVEPEPEVIEEPVVEPEPEVIEEPVVEPEPKDSIDIRFVSGTFDVVQFINNKWTSLETVPVGTTVTIKETVRIEGIGTAPIFCIKFEVIEPNGQKIDHYRDQCTVKEINPETSANPNISSNFNLLPKSPGTYTIIKTIDYKNDVVETDEQNNVSTRTVVVIDDTEPVVEPEPEVIEEPVVEPEPEVIEEPVVEPEPEVIEEPVVEPEPEVIEEPVVEPEPIIPSDTTPPVFTFSKDITIKTVDEEIGVRYSVSAQDETDGSIEPVCDPPSDSKFKIGQTTVTCTATDSAGNVATASFVVDVVKSTIQIPSWIKDTAGWWCDGGINDADYLGAIRYLVENEIIIIKQVEAEQNVTGEVPEWIKNSACWWSQGQISDDDYATGLEYLISSGILVILEQEFEAIIDDISETKSFELIYKAKISDEHTKYEPISSAIRDEPYMINHYSKVDNISAVAVKLTSLVPTIHYNQMSDEFKALSDLNEAFITVSIYQPTGLGKPPTLFDSVTLKRFVPLDDSFIRFDFPEPVSLTANKSYKIGVSTDAQYQLAWVGSSSTLDYVAYYSTAAADSDGDKIADEFDNCPNIVNLNQEDEDKDSFGDVCDEFPSDKANDEDGDGLGFNEDNCPRAYNPDQKDSDNDGIGEPCEDNDNDTHKNYLDNCPEIYNLVQYDQDNDGIGDACDQGDYAYPVTGQMLTEWTNLGGPGGFFGAPAGPETPTPDGAGTYQQFEGGYIVIYSSEFSPIPIVETWGPEGPMFLRPDPDTEPPKITFVPTITVTADSFEGTNVMYTISAEDNVDGTIEVSCDIPSGSFFEIGTKQVICSATDSSNNTTGAKITVTVIQPKSLCTDEDMRQVFDAKSDSFGKLEYVSAGQIPTSDGGKIFGYERYYDDTKEGPALVICHPDTGPYFMELSIAKKYIELDYNNSFLGYPISNIQRGTPVAYQDFEGGSIITPWYHFGDAKATPTQFATLIDGMSAEFLKDSYNIDEIATFKITNPLWNNDPLRKDSAPVYFDGKEKSWIFAEETTANSGEFKGQLPVCAINDNPNGGKIKIGTGAIYGFPLVESNTRVVNPYPTQIFETRTYDIVVNQFTGETIQETHTGPSFGFGTASNPLLPSHYPNSFSDIEKIRMFYDPTPGMGKLDEDHNSLSIEISGCGTNWVTAEMVNIPSVGRNDYSDGQFLPKPHYTFYYNMLETSGYIIARGPPGQILIPIDVELPGSATSNYDDKTLTIKSSRNPILLTDTFTVYVNDPDLKEGIFEKITSTAVDVFQKIILAPHWVNYKIVGEGTKALGMHDGSTDLFDYQLNAEFEDEHITAWIYTTEYKQPHVVVLYKKDGGKYESDPIQVSDITDIPGDRIRVFYGEHMRSSTAVAEN